MKLELKKFLISTILCLVLGIWYHSLFVKFSLVKVITDICSSIKSNPYELIIFIIAYIIFNLIYFSFKYFLKLVKSPISPLKLSTITCSTLVLIYILNRTLIFNTFKDYSANDDRYITDKNVVIDSSNYKYFKWVRKNSTPEHNWYIENESLIFTNDSTILCSVWKLKQNSLMGIKYYLKKFDSEYTYRYHIEGDTIKYKLIDDSKIEYTDPSPLISIRKNVLIIPSYL